MLWACAHRRPPPSPAVRGCSHQDKLFPLLLQVTAPELFAFQSCNFKVGDWGLGDGMGEGKGGRGRGQPTLLECRRCSYLPLQHPVVPGRGVRACVPMPTAGLLRPCALLQVQSSKGGTGRVVGFRELGLVHAFTMEASFCGPHGAGSKGGGRGGRQTRHAP